MGHYQSKLSKRNNKMLRTIIRSEIPQRKNRLVGCVRIDTLECGHVRHVRNSQGPYKTGNCRHCDDLAKGAFFKIGDEVELWDSRTSMPFKLNVAELHQAGWTDKQISDFFDNLIKTARQVITYDYFAKMVKSA